MRRLRRIVPATTATLVLLTGSVSSATAPEAPPVDDVPAEAAPDALNEAARARSRALHDEGRSAYELTDYATALEKFSAAYSELPLSPETQSIRSAIVYNVGITQLRIFELDGDIAHLKRAQVLLNKYLDDYAAAEGIDARTSDVTKKERDLLATIDAELDKADAEANAAAATKTPPAEPDPVQPSEADPEPVDPRKANILVGVGAASLGLGAVGIAIFGTGAALGRRAENTILDNPDANAQRPQDLSDGRAANTLAVVGAIAGGVFTATGVTLLTVGLLRRKRSKNTKLSVAPTPGGLIVGGQF